MKKDYRTIVLGSFAVFVVFAGAISWQIALNRRIEVRRAYVRKLAVELRSQRLKGEPIKISMGDGLASTRNEWEVDTIWNSATTLRFENSKFNFDNTFQYANPNTHYIKYFAAHPERQDEMIELGFNWVSYSDGRKVVSTCNLKVREMP